MSSAVVLIGLSGMAMAATLSVHVHPDPEPSRARQVPAGPRELIPVTTAAVVVDGVKEDAWSTVAPAPPLLPRLEGPAAPSHRAHVARTADGFVMLVPAPSRGEVSTITWDPDGTASAFYVVHLGGPSRVERCSLAQVSVPVPMAVPSRAVPCEPARAAVVCGAVCEVALPDASAVTGAARLLWTVTGPRDAGGTWARGGRVDPWPEQGRWLALGAARIGVEVLGTPALGWHVVVRRRGPDDAPFRWAVHAGGSVLATGAVPDGVQATWQIPPLSIAQGTLSLTAQGSATPVSRVSNLPMGRAGVWVASAVEEDVLTLRYSAPIDRAGVLHVRNARGRVIAATPLEVKAGTGTVHVRRPRWPKGGDVIWSPDQDEGMPYATGP